MFIVSGAIALAVALIVTAQWHSGGELGPLSVVLPLLGLVWVVAIGVRARRAELVVSSAPSAADRPSRRPPLFESTPSGRAERPSDSGRHVSA